MRIKHFAGYGCVNAKVLEKTYNTSSKLNKIKIEVKGNHEYGLNRSHDKYDVFYWLLKRFDKRVLSYSYIENIEYEEDYIKENNLTIDRAVYTITYR